MRELPRQLSADELAELFEGRTRFVERLATLDDPLGRAREVARALTDEEKKEVLDAHPAIGAQRDARRASAARAGHRRRPGVLAELAELNRAYEEKFGFRFVVFVNRRPRREIVPILRERLERTREEELATGARRARPDRDRPMAHVVALGDYWWGWGNLLFRWLHVIAAIAWIGASFYFIALDNHLEPPRDPRDAERGVGGEAWEIHGGGFYRVEKFRVAPERAARAAALVQVGGVHDVALRASRCFVVVYYAHASTFLVDTSVADLSTWEAIAISVGGLVLAWLVYDGLCRAFAERRGRARGARVRVHLRCRAWASWQLFAPRAAYVAGRRDDRDDDGRQRLLRDHPGALGARPREGGGPRARPALERARQAALGAQQLPDAAGRVRDALEPLPVHLRAHATAGSSSSR